jgi:hypothetical protein
VKAFIDESGTIRARNYKRTKGYQNVQKGNKEQGKRTDQRKGHKIQYNELG